VINMAKNEEVTFKSKMSKWIAGLYWGILIFLIVLFVIIPLIVPMPLLEKGVFVATFVIVSIVIFYALWKGYTMRFVICNGRIEIYGVFWKSILKLSNIEDIKKVPIPFGYRLFGASLLGGIYYLPGVGKASVAMTNFVDGVLITTRQKQNYVITPENPQEFIKIVSKEMKGGK